MSILDKHLAFVNEQMKFHDAMVGKYKASPFRATLHKNTYDKLSALSVDLKAADDLLNTQKPDQAGMDAREKGVMQLSLTPEELKDLPQELLDELTGADKIEFAILSALEESGGVISLDKILIAIFRKTGEILKRDQVTSKIFKMGQKNLIFSVPGKKGVYSSESLSGEEASKLFGTLKQRS